MVKTGTVEIGNWNTDFFAFERLGTPHEEKTRDGRAHCDVCGPVTDADRTDETVRRYHGDTFGVPASEIEHLYADDVAA